MTMQYKIFVPLILAFFALPFAGKSQKDLPAEQVEVLKQFEATLLDTKKQTTAGTLPKEDRSTNKLTYTLPTKNLEIQQPAPKIRPLGMKKDKLPEPYKGYVKAGYGIPASPYAEFGYHLAGEPFRMNIHAKHHAANFKNLENQKFAKSFAEIDTKYSTESNIGFSTALSYDRHKVHFYGYDHADTTFAEDVVKQVFSNFGVKLGIANEDRLSGDIDYRVTGDVYFFNDNYASKEQGFDLGLGGTKWIGGKHPIKLDVHTDFTKFKDTVTQNLNNIYFMPSFTYHGDAFALKVGANIVSYKDEFTVFPDLELSVNVIGSSLTAFAGWTGNLQKNTFKSMTTYNPFLTSNPTLRNTSYTKYFGGIRGSFRGAEYSAQLGYKNAKDLALYLNDTITDNKRFAVLYDTVNIFYIEGSTKFSLFKGFDIIGTLSQSVYSPKNEKKAWHLPALESNITGIYRLPEQKIKVKGELYIANGAPYKKLDDRSIDNLGALLDLSFGAEYGITDRIGIFLDINNMLNNKRQRWNGYKVYGLNVLGGIMAKF